MESSQMKKLSAKQLGIALLAGAACAFFSAGVAQAFISKGFGSAEMAAWVQAIGSISALGVAIHVSIRQSEHAAKMIADSEQKATLRRARSVAAVVLRTYDKLKAIETPMREQFPAGLDLSNAARSRTTDLVLLDELAANIKAIPAHDLGSYNMADGLLQIAGIIIAYRTLLEFLIREPERHGNMTVVQNLDGYRKILDEGLHKFNVGIDELGITEPSPSA